MKLKKGVKLRGVQPQIALAMVVADQVYRDFDAVLVVTSVCDRRHSSTSLHYSGNAFDCRISNVPNAAAAVADTIKNRLGYEFDVVLESDHIHVEWQPKTG